MLAQDPERIWRPGELSQAIKATGEVDLEKIQGMHLGLIPRLLACKAIEELEGGYRRAGFVVELPAEIRRPPVQRDEVDDLADEIADTADYLDDLGRGQRTAQIAVWAGRARLLQDRLRERGDATAEARLRALVPVFGRLTAITRETDCNWVDALSRDWSTDWETYMIANQAIVAGTWADLPEDAERDHYRSLLRGLFDPRRYVRPQDAHELIDVALEVLPEEDPELAAAIERFGRPPADRTPPSRRAPRPRERTPPEAENGPRTSIAAAVLELTRGKRALLAGGQGAREEQRLSIQGAFELADLEWVVTERGQVAPFNRLAERIRPGRYDLVFFLAAFASHKSANFVRACKTAGVPIVYLSRGYGVNTIVSAIEEQLVQKKHGVS